MQQTDITIPQSILAKLYDNTGSHTCGGRGFILFYVNEKGEPVMAKKTENVSIHMALEKMMEIYLENQYEKQA